MSPLATLLCGAMISCGLVGVWTATRLRHGRVGALLADAAMLAAMLDVCLLGARVLAPVFWAAALLLIAFATLAVSARASIPERRPAAGHAFALVLTAMTLLLIGLGHVRVESAPGQHHGASGMLVIAVLLATGVHTALAVLQVRSENHERARSSPVVRASAAAVGSVAMGALVLLGAG